MNQMRNGNGRSEDGRWAFALMLPRGSVRTASEILKGIMNGT